MARFQDNNIMHVLLQAVSSTPASAKTTRTSGRAGTKRSKAVEEEVDTAAEEKPSPKKKAKKEPVAGAYGVSVRVRGRGREGRGGR